MIFKKQPGKRSQAAMEFLMTYGWAIMVVLLVLGSLAYFGVLNPSNLLPEKCTFPTGIQCDDFAVDSSSKNVSLKLINGMGQGIIIYNVSLRNGQGYLSGCTLDFTNSEACSATTVDQPTKLCKDGGGGTGYNNKIGLYVPNSGVFTLRIPCSEVIKYEGKSRTYIDLTYYKATGDTTFTHTAVGELLAKAR